MSTYREHVDGIPTRFVELELDTDMPEYIDLYVDDWSQTPRVSISINPSQVEKIRDELSEWLGGRI